jgi:hypothetical protein
MTVKLPGDLMRGWRRLFRALYRQGYPDAGPGDLGEAWGRFLTGLPAALLRCRPVACPDPVNWSDREGNRVNAIGCDHN